MGPETPFQPPGFPETPFQFEPGEVVVPGELIVPGVPEEVLGPVVGEFGEEVVPGVEVNGCEAGGMLVIGLVGFVEVGIPGVLDGPE